MANGKSAGQASSALSMAQPPGKFLGELAANVQNAVVPVLEEARASPLRLVGVPNAVLSHRHPVLWFGRVDDLETGGVVKHRLPAVGDESQPVASDAEDFVLRAWGERKV